MLETRTARIFFGISIVFLTTILPGIILVAEQKERLLTGISLLALGVFILVGMSFVQLGAFPDNFS